MNNHQFIGRADRGCEVCGLPDRTAIHKGPGLIDPRGTPEQSFYRSLRPCCAKCAHAEQGITGTDNSTFPDSKSK